MTKNKNNKDEFIATDPATMFATAKPYIAGAKVQLERYLEAQRIVKTYKMILGGGIDKCMYELSALLEHLDSIEVQLNNRGVQLSTGKVIRQFRNHLRHDARGDVDRSRGTRGQAIGINEKLLVSIGFTNSGVRMGSVELTAQQIDMYITSAETIMWAMILGGKITVINGEKVSIHPRPAEIIKKNNSEASE